MLLPSPLRRVFALALCLAASVPLAHAASSFPIESLFSSLDGGDQYIVLRESAGHDGEQAIGGLVLRATSGGAVREYTLSRGLFSSATAGKAVIIGTSYGVPVCCSQEQVYLPASGEFEMRWFTRLSSVDFNLLPERFLSVDGGTIELVGADSWTYGPLPTSGHEALMRDGKAVPATYTPPRSPTRSYPSRRGRRRRSPRRPWPASTTTRASTATF